jgi:ABC-2 type transport system ATP-binding protein
MNYVELNNYGKKIQGRCVLNNINLEVAQNQIVGLHGRNASGKTMLLRAISGLIRPTSGTVKVRGSILSPAHPFPKSMGIIIETVNFWPHYSGFSCLKVLASIRNTIDDAKIKDTLQRVGLDPEDKMPIRKYSMGMKQRLAIAQAIMEEPELLLLDEPTNSLDTQSRGIFRNIMLEENQRGATIIIASHIREDLELCCNSFYFIENGEIQKAASNGGK